MSAWDWICYILRYPFTFFKDITKGKDYWYGP